jgi:hypothetical protein
MSSENKSKRQRNQPSYLGWRGELLAKLALSRLPNVTITEQPDEGRYDFSATTAENFIFMIEVKALSSIRENIRDIQTVEELRWRLPTSFLRKAKSAACPVILFLFDADTEHGRFLRVDNLILSNTSAQVQTICFPRTNTITTQSLYRMLLELRSFSGQASRVASAQRIAIFDTNAYRELTFGLSLDSARTKTHRLCHLEEAAGWSVLAHPIVVWELVAHLEDITDKAYDHCLKALVALGEHAASRERRDGSINLIADAFSTVCHELFGKLPPGYHQGLLNLGSLVTHVVQHAPSIDDPVARQNIANLSRGMSAKEESWVKGMETVLDHFSPEAAKAVFGEQDDQAALKKARHFFEGEDFMNAWATYLVISNAAEVGVLNLSPTDIQEKAQIVRKIFPVPFHLMSALLQKLATPQPPNLANPKRKRWNFVWDSMISFTLGPGTIGEDPVYLVTGDGDIVDAAKVSGFKDKVLSLDNYLKGIGFP